MQSSGSLCLWTSYMQLFPFNLCFLSDEFQPVIDTLSFDGDL